MKLIAIPLSVFFGLILSALIIAKPWVTIRHAKPIIVKGYAELEVVADSGNLTAEVIVNSSNNATAYNKAGEGLIKMKEIATEKLKNNLDLAELKTTIKEILKLDKNGKKTNLIDYYNVRRKISIDSKDVQGLKKLGRALFDLNGTGLRVSVNGPSFFISNLDDIKLELVQKATENGKKRAILMAKSSGEKLGVLASAKQGIIQITKRNSSKTSSRGVYDTETIDKVVKLVVTLEYEIEK